MAVEAAAFQQPDLSGTDLVYLRVDGIHLEVRLESRPKWACGHLHRPLDQSRLNIENANDYGDSACLPGV